MLLKYAFVLFAAGSLMSGPHAFAEIPKALPADIKWETNDSVKPLGDPAAKKGGTLYSWMLSYPLTFRLVGPDSNGAFAGYMRSNTMSLVHWHPDTDELVPVLASHWAFDADGKTVYYKLNKAAKWSDGKPVTIEDYMFAFDYGMSKEIVDPWTNETLKREYEGVTQLKDKDGSDVFAVTLRVKKPEIIYYTNFSPVPKHFFKDKLNKDFVKATNWLIAPVTGPYIVGDTDRGKSVTFKRVTNWWAKDLPFFKNRFNVDKVVIKVIRDLNAAYKYFEKGELDMFPATVPQVWYEMATGPAYDNGYIARMKVFNDVRQSDAGFWLNEDYELFKDINVRLALAYSLNIDKVIKQIFRGDFERLDGVTQGFGALTDTTIKARPYDIAKAEEYLKKSGWVTRDSEGIFTKDGKRLEATVTYDNEIQAKVLVVLKEEAKKAGFDLKLQQMDSSARFQAYREKKHQIAYMGWSPQRIPEYSQHFHSIDAHKAQTNNITNTDNKDLDKLMEEFRDHAEKQEDRVKIAHEIQHRIYDLGMYIPTYKVPFFRELYWPWIKFPTPPGFRRTDGIQWWLDDDSSDGGQFWIDEAAKKDVKAAMSEKRKLPKIDIVDKTYQIAPAK